jgi:hypothetical protein
VQSSAAATTAIILLKRRGSMYKKEKWGWTVECNKRRRDLQKVIRELKSEDKIFNKKFVFSPLPLFLTHL